MITKTPAYLTSDGNAYASLEIAQRAELLKLVTTNGAITDDHANPVLNIMFERLDDVKEILRCTGRKARKAKAGRNGKRKASTTVEEAK